jgi:hypothetical protein
MTDILQPAGFISYINASNGTPLLAEAVSISSSGNNTVVAAGTASQIIRVYRLLLVPTAAVTITLQDGGSTALSGAMPLAANQVFLLPFDTDPWVITSPGNAFIAKLGSGVAVNGMCFFTIGV